MAEELTGKEHAQVFEILIARVLAETYRAILAFTNTPSVQEEHPASYSESIERASDFIDIVRSEIMLALSACQGEFSSCYKLYLHVLHEVEAGITLIRSILEGDCVPPGALEGKIRGFESVHASSGGRSLMMVAKYVKECEQRSRMIETSFDLVRLVFSVRKAMMHLLACEREHAYYLMKLARAYRKYSKDILTITNLFKECQKSSAFILTYELEYAKFTYITKNAYEAYTYLKESLETISKKCYKETTNPAYAHLHAKPMRIYQRANLYMLKLMEKIDPDNAEINTLYNQFNKNTDAELIEKFSFAYACYLDKQD